MTINYIQDTTSFLLVLLQYLCRLEDQLVTQKNRTPREPATELSIDKNILMNGQNRTVLCVSLWGD